VCRSLKSRKKITKTPYFGGSRSFKVIDVGTPGKVDISARYDEQQNHLNQCQRSYTANPYTSLVSLLQLFQSFRKSVAVFVLC